MMVQDAALLPNALERLAQPAEQRASPDTTDLAIRDECIIARPFKVEESRSMPCFGQSGMGLQYETFTGAKMPVSEVVLTVKSMMVRLGKKMTNFMFTQSSAGIAALLRYLRMAIWPKNTLHG
ncbi:MAG: TNT domain-containing protein [Hydrogenophaga sp.]|uniref:hypothetical protein n=1 Tax=Hydrogenophaga sp. TaxID=1904254 RepID=UPI0026202462|nr:hypothetical protein [Hydrogenophaga sp.]MCV0438424.1 TNT domain-containing protein [Hydrogenophaga sp.]